jgi:hypothetical protein
MHMDLKPLIFFKIIEFELQDVIKIKFLILSFDIHMRNILILIM